MKTVTLHKTPLLTRGCYVHNRRAWASLTLKRDSISRFAPLESGRSDNLEPQSRFNPGVGASFPTDAVAAGGSLTDCERGFCTGDGLIGFVRRRFSSWEDFVDHDPFNSSQTHQVSSPVFKDQATVRTQLPPTSARYAVSLKPLESKPC